MQRSPLLIVTVVAASFAVAGFAPDAARAQQKNAPSVQRHKVRVIADKYVTVDQQPIVVLGDDHHGKIVWELPPAPSPYRFHQDGIAIDDNQFLGCHMLQGGFKYECTDRMPREHKRYPYRITVHGPDKDAPPLTADAEVLND